MVTQRAWPPSLNYESNRNADYNDAKKYNSYMASITSFKLASSKIWNPFVGVTCD